MADATVLTEVGRIVWGHPSRMTQNTDDDNKPIFNDDGTPQMSATFGLALPKATFGAVWAAMQAAAVGVPGAGQADFAWKYKDGDTASDRNGKPFRDMPGRAGCIILTISTSIREMTAVSKHIGGGQFQSMGENEVKCGDFIRTALKIVGHGPNTKKKGSKSGLYLNPQGHEFIGYGEAISSGPDAATLFGSAPVAQLPPGASATPVASSGGSLPPGMGGPGAVPTMPAASPVTPPGMPQTFAPSPAPMPAPGFVPAAVPTMPQASPVGMPAPVPTAFPSSPAPMPVATPQPHPQFVQQAMPAPAPQPVAPQPVASPQPGGMGNQPVGYDPATGRAVFGYTLHNGQNFPIFGYNPDGTPIYV